MANHTGWDHVWTKIHPEYFKKDSNTNDFKIASGMDDIIELDYKNPDLRKAMIDAMQYWVTETDIDGYRCDLAFWVELDFWLEARAELEKTKRSCLHASILSQTLMNYLSLFRRKSAVINGLALFNGYLF